LQQRRGQHLVAGFFNGHSHDSAAHEWGKV
jgi:hypothetical protein